MLSTGFGGGRGFGGGYGGYGGGRGKYNNRIHYFYCAYRVLLNQKKKRKQRKTTRTENQFCLSLMLKYRFDTEKICVRTMERERERV